MNRSHPILLGFGAVLATGSVSAQDSFNDFFWSPRILTGFDYSAGKFGEAETTEIAFVPLSIQTARGPFTFKLAGGWLSVAGPALILDGAGVAAAKPGVSRHASGFSDATFSAMYSIQQLYDRGVYVDLSARLKLPSASFKKGLGTGKVDGAGQLDLAVALGNFMPFATAGYKVNGVRETLKVRNVAYGTLGLQYAWDERVATGLTYDYRQSALRTSSDPEEASLYLSYRVSDAWSFNAYGVVGLSRNSPDAGGGITFIYRFAPSESPFPVLK
jgi:hypothetical protein